MTIDRYYTESGLPKYVTRVKEGEDGVRGILLLVYPSAKDFQKLWDQGTDAPEIGVDGKPIIE